MKYRSLYLLVLTSIMMVLVKLPAFAYPEFQTFIVKNSGRAVNCAMCHAHSDGPDGAAPGQIGRLTAAEQERLGRARAAFEPGAPVDSPILNSFGNHLLKSIGKTKLLEIKLSPEQLSDAMPKGSDLDHDGIPDWREYLDGTHPANRHDGRPWLLFKHNFARNLPSILLTLTATVAGMWGLAHLLHGFAAATRIKEDEEDQFSA
jgi:hypothetical protein